jgi:hypothetical protein
MHALASLLLTIAPPPFVWEWPAVREHWPHVSPELEASIQVGAVVGGFVGDVAPSWLVESSFRPRVVGDRGTSFGLCQLKRRTARGAWPAVTTGLLLDPVVNLTVAGGVYRRIIAKYGRALAQQYYGCGYPCGVTQGGESKVGVVA